MKIVINHEKCTLCGKCIEVCPMNLIKRIVDVLNVGCVLLFVKIMQ